MLSVQGTIPDLEVPQEQAQYKDNLNLQAMLRLYMHIHEENDINPCLQIPKDHVYFYRI